MYRTPLLAAVLAALALTGCSSKPASTAAPAPAASSPPAVAPSPTPTYCPGGSRLPNGDCAIDPSAPADDWLINDRVAWTVCPAALRVTSADMASPDKMEQLGKQAATSQDVGLATDGQLLADRARLAKAAKGTSNEASTARAMAESAADITAKCRAAGYKA